MNVRAKLNVTAVSAKAVPYSVGGGGGNLQQQSLMSAAQMGAFLATEPPWAGILCWRHADIAWEGLFKRAVVGLKLDPTDLRLCFWRQGQKMWKVGDLSNVASAWCRVLYQCCYFCAHSFIRLFYSIFDAETFSEDFQLAFLFGLRPFFAFLGLFLQRSVRFGKILSVNSDDPDFEIGNKN